MLKNSFYIIRSINDENNFITAIIELNAKHEIFKGHFPGQAVLPGACMLQMIKEITEGTFQMQLQLMKADEIKFLQLIQPSTEQLEFSVQYNFTDNSDLKLSATITMNNIICCKMKLLFKKKV